jgi:plastocyanin
MLGTAAAVLAMMVSVPAASRDTSMSIRDNFFSKPFLVLTVGDSITWRNKGDLAHTVVTYSDAPRSFDSSPGTTNNCRPLTPLGSADCVEPGDSYGVTFTRAGTYDYYCKVAGHADASVRPDPDVRDGREQPCGMCGRIVVNEVSQPTRTPSPSPSPTGQGQQTADPSPTATRTPSPSPAPTDADGSPFALDDQAVADDGAGGTLAVAFVALVVLSGAGYVVWRRYLQT